MTRYTTSGSSSTSNILLFLILAVVLNHLRRLHIVYINNKDCKSYGGKSLFHSSIKIAIRLPKFRMMIISYHSLILTNGRTTLNVAPLPSVLLVAYNFPSCASIIFLEIYRPNPVPLWDLVANFAKALYSWVL